MQILSYIGSTGPVKIFFLFFDPNRGGDRQAVRRMVKNSEFVNIIILENFTSMLLKFERIQIIVLSHFEHYLSEFLSPRPFEVWKGISPYKQFY